MKTDEELRVLYSKFDRDVAKRGRGMRLLLALDQFFNVLIYNGSQDETISSHIARLQKSGSNTKFDDWLCCLLSKIEFNHCEKSLGE